MSVSRKGTISITGAPGWITPPTVVTCMFLTVPRKGARSTVRSTKSRRPAATSDTWESSLSIFDNSVPASAR